MFGSRIKRPSARCVMGHTLPGGMDLAPGFAVTRVENALKKFTEGSQHSLRFFLPMNQIQSRINKPIKPDHDLERKN